MKKFFYLFCAGALLLAGGCSDDSSSDSDSNSGQERKIAFADIVDAESLYLTEKSGSRASDEDEAVTPTLYKITLDNTTEAVTFADEEGNSLDAQVESFRRLSDRYIYMMYIWDHTYGHVIIRRSDGAVFKMDPAVFGKDSHNPIINNETEIQTDCDENVYFKQRRNNLIYKIYTNEDEVYATQISRNDMQAWLIDDCDQWLVDRRGNVLINEDYMRLVSGNFARYTPTRYTTYPESAFFVWNDSEGFYALEADSRMDSNQKIYIYTLKYCQPVSPTTSFEMIKTWEGELAQEALFTPLVYKDKTVLFQLIEGDKRYRFDIYGKNRIELTEMEFCPLPDDIRFAYYGQKYPHTGKYLYGKSESEIWRIDVETGVPEMLYKYGDDFVIKTMTVRNDIVTFTAFELRSGNDVIAELYPDKTVKVLESINGDKIVQFERLN